MQGDRAVVAFVAAGWPVLLGGFGRSYWLFGLSIDNQKQTAVQAPEDLAVVRAVEALVRNDRLARGAAPRLLRHSPIF